MPYSSEVHNKLHGVRLIGETWSPVNSVTIAVVLWLHFASTSYMVLLVGLGRPVPTNLATALFWLFYCWTTSYSVIRLVLDESAPNELQIEVQGKIFKYDFLEVTFNGGKSEECVMGCHSVWLLFCHWIRDFCLVLCVTQLV